MPAGTLKADPQHDIILQTVCDLLCAMLGSNFVLHIRKRLLSALGHEEPEEIKMTLTTREMER